MENNTVKSIGQYQLGDCIGKGAFGAVYRALNMETGEVVAIKQIRLANIPKAEVNSLMMEIDLLKKLNHQNIVKYSGFIKSMDYLYIILEFCENGSLQSVVKKFGKMSETLVSVYIYQVLQGLMYLHDEGVIHRDIKGANILTTKEGHVKLGDFGVATKQADGDDSAVVGSPYWMAPEVVEMTVPTTASDIWSVGCTIIELIQGVPPYFSFPPMAALFKIVQDDHPPFPDEASPLLKDFLMQCFQKDYNLRTSAKKLSKHGWLQSARAKLGAINENVSNELSKKTLRNSTSNVLIKAKKGTHSSSDLSLESSTTQGNNVQIESFIEDQGGFEDDFDDDIGFVITLKLTLDFEQRLRKQVNDQGDVTDESHLSLSVDSEHDDPFSTLDGSDSDAPALGRDVRGKLSGEIMDIIGAIGPEKDEKFLIEGLSRLTNVFVADPTLSTDLIKYHGVIPCLTLLENSDSEKVLISLLTMMDAACEGSTELLENFCLLGVAPRIIQLGQDHKSLTRIASSKVIKRLYVTNDTTRRVFVSCRGIDVLIDMLDCDYELEKDLVWIAIDGIFTILNFQGSAPRNDFCRLLVRRDGVIKLVEIMHQLVFDRNTDADELLRKVLETLNIFSRSDAFVKDAMADHTVMRRIFYEYQHLSPTNQLLLLKSLKNVSVNSSVLDTCQRIGAAEKLVKMLSVHQGQIIKEISNQAIYILFNFCRVNKIRQELAAAAGIVPHLQHLIESNNPLKQLALPIICDLAHCSRTTREILWNNAAMKIYLSLLADSNTYWQVSGLEAIVTWLNEDGEKIEEELLDPKVIELIINMYVHSKVNTLPTLIVPIQKLVNSSSNVCKSMSKGPFIQKLLEHINAENVTVKLNSLKILFAVIRSHSRPKLLSSTYDIGDHVSALVQSNNCPVIAREIAGNILQYLTS